MKTRTYKVYEFKELSKEAKEKAIANWYEHEDYPMLDMDLTESCKALLEENNIAIQDGLKLYYSLSNCQGDGLCFIGTFHWEKYYISIQHNARYYYAKSTNITIQNEESEEIDNEKVLAQFTQIYLNICDKLEKEGYGILEYRMDNKEFQEHCESNDYMFTSDGKID